MPRNAARCWSMNAAIPALALGVAGPVSARQQGAAAAAAIRHATPLVPAVAAQLPERPALSSNPRVTTIEPDGEVQAPGSCQEEPA